ncbi:ArsR/SmtB family transcription factor [Winogradskya consettensis]|nr:helix-turn-helix domain-containing protein [Actinoplanes consettensis]
MSLGEEPGHRQARLRAMSHPVRLRMMSLLTGAGMTAAELARELGLTHANASYHLRNLHAVGLIVQEGEERIRGGVAKRYRYVSSARDHERPAEGFDPGWAETQRGLFSAVADELIRRTNEGDWTVGASMTDAELWVDPDLYRSIRDRLAQLSRELHSAAQAPRTPGTVRTSTTFAMFRMEES